MGRLLFRHKPGNFLSDMDSRTFPEELQNPEILFLSFLYISLLYEYFLFYLLLLASEWLLLSYLFCPFYGKSVIYSLSAVQFYKNQFLHIYYISKKILLQSYSIKLLLFFLYDIVKTPEFISALRKIKN